MLITDVHSVSNLQLIEEASSKNNHRPKVRGLFQRADEANQNKRVYPKTILESQVKKLQPLIAERRLCGELDHPQNDTVKLTNASHLVTKLWMEGSEVMGEAEILNTPNGKVAQALISDGVKIGISSRGLGTLSEDHMSGQKTVNEDYNLVTFDLVADPSTRGAYPTLAEGRILEEARYERTLKEAVEERVFITMLKNRLVESAKPEKKKREWKIDSEEEEDTFEKSRGTLAGAKGISKRGHGEPNPRQKKAGPPARDIEDGNDPHEGEPDHLKSIRQANQVSSDITSGAKPKDAGKRAGTPKKGTRASKRTRGAASHGKNRANDSKEYIYTRTMEKLQENQLKNRVRELAENARKGYPGMKGGSKAAKREAKRRGY